MTLNAYMSKLTVSRRVNLYSPSKGEQIADQIICSKSKSLGGLG